MQDITFPNGVSFSLEEMARGFRTINEVTLPYSYGRKKLVVLGTQCCGKSTLINDIGGSDQELWIPLLPYDCVKDKWYTYGLYPFSEGSAPAEAAWPAFNIHNKENPSRASLGMGHGLFYLSFLFEEETYRGIGLDDLSLDLSFMAAPKSLRERLLFEVKVIEPSEVVRLMAERHENEMITRRVIHRYDPAITPEDILKQHYLLMQFADRLQEIGFEVYVRTGFGGLPQKIAGSYYPAEVLERKLENTRYYSVLPPQGR